MSKTGIVWLILYISGLGASFIKEPLWGLLTYMFTFYTQFSWGRGVTLLGTRRVSLIASLVTLLSYLIKKGRLEKLSYDKMPQLKWLILIFIDMILITPFAAWPEKNNEAVVTFFKLFILYYIIVRIIRNKLYYKYFIWLQVFGNYLFGWQAFTRGRITGGRLENIGGPGIFSSNYLANHMLMIIPFLGNMFLFGGKWEKIAAIWVGPFILNTLIHCNSRAAFLGLLVMGALIIFFTKKEMRLKIIIGSGLGLILFVRLTNPQFWVRMQSIESHEDNSAIARLESWESAIRMIKDHPLGKGGGGWKFYSPIYIPEIVSAHGGAFRSIHNTYLMMATNWGIQGLILLLAFLSLTFLELFKIRKRYGTEDDTFYHTESTAIIISIIGFLACAFFGNRIYAESLYWYCALAAALRNIQQSELLNKKSNISRDSDIDGYASQ